MTRKQKEKLKRNQEICELSKTLTIEEVSARFNLSVPHVYKIIQYEKWGINYGHEMTNHE